MNPYTKVAIVAALLAAGAAGGFGLEHTIAAAQIATIRTKHADTLRGISDVASMAAQAALMTKEAADKAKADLDTKFTKEKTDALADNSRRAAGPERVRIATQCPARGGDVPAAASTTSVDDGKADLTPEARSAFWTTRAALIEDVKKLEGLQAYASKVCASAASESARRPMPTP